MVQGMPQIPDYVKTTKLHSLRQRASQNATIFLLIKLTSIFLMSETNVHKLFWAVPKTCLDMSTLEGLYSTKQFIEWSSPQTACLELHEDYVRTNTS